MKRFRLAPGFRIELVACEPQIREPVALAWDGNGRLFVVEMRGYMQDIDATGAKDPVGRISLLEDTDGDGKLDTKELVSDKFSLRDSNVEHKANSLLWGIDNWIHVSQHGRRYQVIEGKFRHQRVPSIGQ